MALRADGTVWAWGDNTYGQLGDGTFLSRNYPVQVSHSDGTAFTDIVDIAAGDTFTLLLTKEGNAWLLGELEGVTTAPQEVVDEDAVDTYEPEYCPNWNCDGDIHSGALEGEKWDKPTGYDYSIGEQHEVDDLDNPVMVDDLDNPIYDADGTTIIG